MDNATHDEKQNLRQVDKGKDTLNSLKLSPIHFSGMRSQIIHSSCAKTLEKIAYIRTQPTVSNEGMIEFSILSLFDFNCFQECKSNNDSVED